MKLKKVVLTLIFVTLCTTIPSPVGVFDHCGFGGVGALGVPLQFYGALQTLLQTWPELDYHELASDCSLLRHFTPPKTHHRP